MFPPVLEESVQGEYREKSDTRAASGPEKVQLSNIFEAGRNTHLDELERCTAYANHRPTRSTRQQTRQRHIPGCVTAKHAQAEIDPMPIFVPAA
jgi:hypothetical protein